MRDLVLLAFLLGVAPLIVRAPFVGLLVWIWVTLMNPQREVYGVLAGFNINVYVAGLTVASWLLSRERKAAGSNAVVAGFVVFAVWTAVSAHFALEPERSLPIAQRTLKTLLLAYMVAALITTPVRVQAMLWTYMAAFGYFALKGGGFVLLTAGRHRVFGPQDSPIADNNALGLALTVVLPLMNHLRVTSRRPAVRWACLATMLAAVLSVLGTYSRGALLALCAAAAAYALRARHGMFFVAAAAVLAAASPSLLPSGWLDRMQTIQAYNRDSSFEGRVAAWRTSLAVARARPLVGGGFAAVESDAVARDFPADGGLQAGRAAHSIFFEVLGDMGFVGLGLYLLLLAGAWVNTMLVLAAARARPDLSWASHLARMLQVSMVALAVGGAALSMAYYDGFLMLFALTAALRGAARGHVRGVEGAPAPRWRRSTGPSPGVGAGQPA